MLVIKHPVISEKSAISATNGLYVFEVSSLANKVQVAAAVKEMFDVEPTDVRMVNLPAKKVKFKRIPGVRAKRSRAYVQLKKGDKLKGFEQLIGTDKEAKAESKDK